MVYHQCLGLDPIIILHTGWIDLRLPEMDGKDINGLRSTRDIWTYNATGAVVLRVYLSLFR